jgi:arylsulfatase A-like enzyme
MPDVPDNAYYDGAQTDFAVNKLGELANADKPFFYGVGYYRPHLPFNAPKRYWDMYERDAIPLAKNRHPPNGAPSMALNNMRELRGYTDFTDVQHPMEGILNDDDQRLLKHGYLASVSYLDTQIGKLLDRLDELGIRDNTIVILWVDHGWKLGEHGSWGKMTNYECDTRVPLIISAPGCERNGRCRGLVENIDIYPTFCELVGITPIDGLEGQSLAPQLRSPQTPTKDAAFSQFYREGIWLGPSGREHSGYAIRTDTHRYVEWYDHETKELVARELYDHTADSAETRNVADAAENSTVVSELSGRLPVFG